MFIILRHALHYVRSSEVTSKIQTQFSFDRSGYAEYSFFIDLA